MPPTTAFSAQVVSGWWGVIIVSCAIASGTVPCGVCLPIKRIGKPPPTCQVVGYDVRPIAPC